MMVPGELAVEAFFFVPTSEFGSSLPTLAWTYAKPSLSALSTSGFACDACSFMTASLGPLMTGDGVAPSVRGEHT